MVDFGGDENGGMVEKERRWEGKVRRDKHAIRRGADAWTWMVRVVCGNVEMWEH